MAKLGNICEILNGYAFKSEKYVNDGIRVIRITNVQKGYIEDTEPKFYPIEYSDELSKYSLKNGDLLMSLTGNVGRVAILTNNFLPAALNQRVACLRLRTTEILKQYLFHVLNSDYFEQMCIMASNGIAQKNLSTEWLKEFEIPDFSIDKQNQIVANLDKVTRLIELCNAILEKLDLLVKARFVEMFGDPVNNSYNLPVKTLSELGELGRGVSKHRPRNAPELLVGKYPLIQTGDVANADLYINEYKSTYSEIGYKQSKMWSKNTLCITIAANIAKTAILTFDSCFPDSVVGFNANNMTNNLYIHYWFTFFQAILEEQAPESAQKNINLKILSELKVVVPPIELQNQFADFVKQTDKSKLAIKQLLEKAETLKKALMQEYFG